jgi:hypothetical protein
MSAVVANSASMRSGDSRRGPQFGAVAERERSAKERLRPAAPLGHDRHPTTRRSKHRPCRYRLPSASNTVAPIKPVSPKPKSEVARRGACFHSPVQTPDSVAVMIMKI